MSKIQMPVPTQAIQPRADVLLLELDDDQLAAVSGAAVPIAGWGASDAVQGPVAGW